MEQAAKKRKHEETISDNNSSEDVQDGEDELAFVNDLSIADLCQILDERKVPRKDIVEKAELIARVRQQLEKDKREGIPIKKKQWIQRRDCPYLDTIDRKLLDFDFEKLCSVTLQNLNVYACLVCGKYFQGRGRNSPAHIHSLQANHHVFINLQDEKVYCLPDGYEVIDHSLSDIKYNLNPTFTPEEVMKLDKNTKAAVALDGTEYIPGYIGLNNIKHTDYLNVVVQALAHVPPLRNYFMVPKNYAHSKSVIVHRFGELVRKLYNAKGFRAHVSPHELLQEVSLASKKKFQIGVLSDPLEFLQWFLNTLHTALGGSKKPGSSIIHQVFQGFVEVETEKEVVLPDGSKKTESSNSVVPFLNLSLDVPAAPLFKDESEKNIIPQIPIFDLLTKYDGRSITHIAVTGERKKFKITKLPPYLILHIKRFTKNNWFLEKNPTIVTFPLKNLDLKDFTKDIPKEECKYDLISNICHEGEADKGAYRVYLIRRATDQWFEIQDLTVKQTMPQMIPLSESYIQIYENQAKR